MVKGPENRESFMKNCFYKVVTKDMTSLIGIEGYLVRYRKGVWIKPKLPGSKLFCFKSLKAAKKFARNQWSMVLIFKCLVENAVECWYIPQDLGYIKTFWRHGMIPLMPAPDGTMICDKILLKEEVC